MSYETDKARRQWDWAVRMDGGDQLGQAGRLHLTAKPEGPGCTVVHVHASPIDPGAPTWRQCGMPVFALVDLERHDLDLPDFGVCFGHAVKIAEDAPYIPIRQFVVTFAPMETAKVEQA